MYRILLAEDEKMIRNGLRHLINQVIGGFEVVWEAENGRRALEIMQIEKPDLLVTDIRMPGIDGLELIRRIRHLLMDMPVIVVSGFDDFEYAKKAMKFGVRHYMLKPVEPAEMAEALSEIREELSEEPSRASYKGESRLIKQIKEIVDDELSNTITLQLIGDMVHLHPNYVSHIFKKETGQTLIDYVMRRRMEQAGKLLRETNLKIYDVARLVGYQSAKHFANMFRQFYQCSPSEYRLEPKELDS